MKKFLVTYFFFLFFFFSFFASGFVDSQDGFQYLAVARRIFYDKTFEMPKEIFRETDSIPKNIHMSYAPGKEGKLFSPTGLGFSLALLPAVAIEDLFLNKGNLTPLSAFPLQSDWPVLLFASMTNAFFGALLGITMYLYLRSFKIKHKRALFLSFLTLIATNLFPYTKHVFPHMMFVSFLTLAFYLLRLHSQKKRASHIVGAGASFGLVILSYNPTYLLSVVPLGIYYLLLNKFSFKKEKIRKALKDGISFILGALPFYSLYSWFNATRFGGGGGGGYSGGISSTLAIERPIKIIFEGIWGVLLSPGRSFFLYSPILILIFIFWFKLKKNLKAEVVTTFVLFVFYTISIGTLLGNVDFPLWHGESSWGPRYMLPVIPLAMILVANLYEVLSKKSKIFIFTPLILVGLWIQIIGILLPYQIKFRGLSLDNFLNDRNFNVYEYGNEIPRYSPILTMSSTLLKRVKDIRLLSPGKYNLKLLDGFDTPFNLGFTVWRAVKPKSLISFENTDPGVESLSIQIKNHQINTKSKYPLRVIPLLNGERASEEVVIKPEEEKVIEIDLKTMDKLANSLTLETAFMGTSSAFIKNNQVAFLENIKINGEAQNIASINYPYVSPISQKLYGEKYYYWGGDEKSPWEIWHMHSAIYEATFDLWWTRPFHYWDLPKKFFVIFAIFDLGGIIILGFYTYKQNSKRNI